MLVFGFNIGLADSPKTTNPESAHQLLSSTKNTNRPNAPSRLTLGCEYGPGFLNFIFPPYFDSVTFELIQNGSIVFSDCEEKKCPRAA